MHLLLAKFKHCEDGIIPLINTLGTVILDEPTAWPDDGVGRPLGEFVADDAADHADVPVQVYPSTIDGGGR